MAKKTRKRFDTGGYMADGGEVEYKINKLYEKSNFINDDFNWETKLLEMLQDGSIEAYNIYQSLNNSQKEDVLQQLFEMDNYFGMEGDGNIETSKENLEILLEDAKKGSQYAKGGKVKLIFHGSSREIPMGEFNSAADAKRYVESSDWQRPYSIKKINKKPKVVRTQFEEEVFEYADGGETYANYEMVLIAKELEKDGGYKHKFRYLVSAKDINEAKNIVTEQWYEEMSNSDLSLVNIMSDEEYRLNHMGKKMAKGGETKPSLIPDYSKISNVEVSDIDRNDAPDYVDAYISYAEYDGEPMTEEQLEELNYDGDFVYSAVERYLYADGGKVRQNKKDKLWESIKNKFSEIFYLKETDSNEIFSNDVTAEKEEYLYFASAWVTTTLSFEEAENKFKRMLTDDEKKIIKIERNVKDVNEAFGVMSEKKILVKRIDKMAKGGKVKSRWIQDALTGNKGALRKTAKRKGLIRGDEKLSKSDLNKLEKMGGKTARRARLAETLIDFKK